MSVFDRHSQAVDRAQPLAISGPVCGVRGLCVSVADFPAPVGASCRIARRGGDLEARVIGFAGDQTLVMPMGGMEGICRGDRVDFTAAGQCVAVGPAMLGRVIDSFARPIDGLGDTPTEARVPLWPPPIPPMQRKRITAPLATGVRAIDSLLTVGRGQRMGIFSGSGVGKSVLLGMISRNTSADVIVIGLIGERGREVRDFIDKDLGPQGLARAVVVVSTSDEPPLVRVQAGATACAVAEFFRDQGLNVLLLVDSLSRLASAQRQIGLAAGEPPAAKGYTPSVFNLLPQMLERAGATQRGTITAFYTALAEGDDVTDPVVDAIRSVTDGHVVLSRAMALRGQYPAVDVLNSVSRVMIDVTDEHHQAAAREVRRQMAMYEQVEDLVTVGAYQGGANAEYDLAIATMPLVRQLLEQGIGETADFATSRSRLEDLHRWVLSQRQQSQRKARLRPAHLGREGKVTHAT